MRKSNRVLNRVVGRAALIEAMELRTMLSTSAPVVTPEILNHSSLIPIVHPVTGGSSSGTSSPDSGYTSASSVGGLSVAAVRGAYGVSGITFGSTLGDGTGQTIAVVDAYNDPDIASDLKTFDAGEGLANPTLTVINETGGTTLPANDSTNTESANDWAGEETLDVEWAHAIAPGASILVVECNSSSDSDLFTGVATAAKYAGVSVVSNSYGGSEASNEASSEDSYFTTPSGHAGVTFVASAGDTPGDIEYPAESPNVVAVGGTQLLVSGTTWSSETVWDFASEDEGTGGGTSAYETQPSYQAGTVTSSKREVPDLSIAGGQNSDSSSSYVPIVDSWDYGTSAPWSGEEGTSWSSPMISGMIAIADQGRSLEGLGTLTSAQTLTRLYQLPKAAYHDITTGSIENTSTRVTHSAATGYDEASGIGTPIANQLVADLAGAVTVTGQIFEDNAGTGVYNSAKDTPLANQTVYLDLNNDGTLDNGEVSTTTNAQGVYTFTNVSAGGVVRLSSSTAIAGYSLTTPTSSTVAYGSSTTINFIYSIVPSQLSITQQSTATASVGTTLSPVIVSIENSAGTVAGNASSIVTLTLSQGTFSTGSTTATATAVNGVATFGNLQINAVGNYTLTATDGTLTSAVSSAVTVSPGVPVITWAAPASIIQGTTLSAAQLEATASVPGTFSYTPAAGTVLSAGSNQNLSVLFTPTDSADYTTASATVPINVIALVAINLTGSNFYLRLDPSNPQNLDIWTNSTASGTPALVQSMSTVSSITLSATSAVDKFVADFSNGSITPTGGLTFNGFGAAGANSLTVIGTGTDTLASTSSALTINSQSVNYSNASVYFAPSANQSLTVTGGSITLAPGTASGITTDTFSNISIASGAQLNAPFATNHGNRLLILTTGLNIASSNIAGSISWTGTLDLSNNDLDLANGNLAAVTSQVAQGLLIGSGGILSSAASSDTTFLTTLGVIQNSVDGTPSGAALFGSNGPNGLFDGASPSNSDVLIKYTYFGDANLDGTVDGSDYSRIDAAYGTNATGWFNGDFNYDGSVNGSDYTLIDNTFNQQGVSLAAMIAPVASPAARVASPSAQISSVSVFSNVKVKAPHSGSVPTAASSSGSSSILSIDSEKTKTRPAADSFLYDGN